MEQSNNKKRILALINILKKQSDQHKRIKLDEIVFELNKQQIEVNNRKTLYDDFKVLNEFGYDIEYDNGYYLLEAPFNLSEIKIILDSLHSLKNLDAKMLQNLNNKLYSFISNDEQKLLENIQYEGKHKDTKLLQKMEDVLEAIYNHTSIVLLVNAKEIEVYPLFLQRENDYYYFYYHYPNSEKLYHYRFDNVKNIKLTKNIDTISISRNKIITLLEESSKSYSSGKAKLILIDLFNQDERIIKQFLDDFPNAICTKNGFSLKADINNIFFSKLVAYGKNIKIKDKDTAKEYKNYLKEIIQIN